MTPAPTVHEALSLTIQRWCTDNPGRHRPNEVAAAIPARNGMTDAAWRQRVANEMGRMARNGVLTRGRVTDNEMGPGVLYWLAKDAPPLEQHTVRAVLITCSCEQQFGDQEKFKAHQQQARNPKQKRRKAAKR